MIYSRFCRGGSRISRSEAKPDRVGADVRHECFSTKTCAKLKNWVQLGGAVPGASPGSANDLHNFIQKHKPN